MFSTVSNVGRLTVRWAADAFQRDLFCGVVGGVPYPRLSYNRRQVVNAKCPCVLESVLKMQVYMQFEDWFMFEV